MTARIFRKRCRSCDYPVEPRETCPECGGANEPITLPGRTGTIEEWKSSARDLLASGLMGMVTALLPMALIALIVASGRAVWGAYLCLIASIGTGAWAFLKRGDDAARISSRGLWQIGELALWLSWIASVFVICLPIATQDAGVIDRYMAIPVFYIGVGLPAVSLVMGCRAAWVVLRLTGSTFDRLRIVLAACVGIASYVPVVLLIVDLDLPHSLFWLLLMSFCVGMLLSQIILIMTVRSRLAAFRYVVIDERD